ncbi:cytochrome P450 [Xenococcus sp. PCC 7305]|uniref:cytochrome P450 n=1 Tax=Xenococcus sp. PCC 7305 TaxID=102125 RepID=UPI0002ACB06F|nr:cytochrome P450 [Xenococcus sp. PCC 7305]ELS04684.1 cytochrome P450 [Xenococcus sp. PCC 7305]
MTLPNGPKTTGKLAFLRRFKLIFRPLEYLDDYAQTYGDIIKIGGEKSAPFVYLSNPEGIRQILATDPELFVVGKGNRILRFLVGDNSLLLMDGHAHQRQRQLVMPTFHSDRLKDYSQLIWNITQQSTAQWPIGKPFAIRPTMQEITLQVILQVVFGVYQEERSQRLRQLITALLDSFDTPISSSMIFFSFLQKDWGAWSPWGRFLRLKQQIKELIYEEIRERRSKMQDLGAFNSNYTDILSLLLSAKDEAGQTMTDEELHDNLMSLLIAGHETTASALVWAFYWVNRDPEVRDNLRQELDSLGENPTPLEIAKLSYLNAVCAETLRIYPIVPSAFIRVAKSPLEIMGYQFPAGSAFALSIYLLHQREDLYPSAKQFKPERFLAKKYPAHEYLPFGGSNRRCIGSALALLEMKLVLANIISRFDLKLQHNRPVKPVRRGLTFAPPGNLKMIAKPRSCLN